MTPPVHPVIPTAHRAEALRLWERQARPVMESITAPDAGPARAVVVGNAGSGKSTMLRELHRLLSDSSMHGALLADGTDIARVPRSHVLLVDDLHLLGADRVDQVRARSEDPDAGLVVAGRPWPRMDGATRIARRLERSRPALVLGHVSRSDVLTSLQSGERVISSACVDDLLECTGGVSWLMGEALALHDERDCADDGGHRALRRDIEERIAHRLETIPALVRHHVEELCVNAAALAHPRTEQDDLIAQGYAEGLLMRSGLPVPLVRAAVRATIPVARLIDLSGSLADGLARSAAEGDPDYRGWVGGIRDAGIATALADHADRVLDSDPRRALELYGGALECGLDPAALAGRRAQAAWAAGDADLACSIVDSVAAVGDPPDAGRMDDTSAAIWSMRGMMRMSDAVYRARPPGDDESRTRAVIAAIGSGQAFAEQARRIGRPSTLGVSMELLERGLRATLSADGAATAVADLVRASELYTASATAAPVPELPAVIAAIVAVNVGDLDIATRVVEDAIAGGHGGAWARGRLLLWRSWLAVQRARPSEAHEALAQAAEAGPSSTARDRVLAAAVRVAIARRYEDAAVLENVWTDARDSVLHVEPDLFLLLPLAELITSAARVDDPGRLQAHLAQALEIVERLGSPPLWSAHLRWAGIQQGILLNRPDDLKPHARALVAASPHSRVAAVMAKAGRVWTATLAGSVDPDAVEAAAHGLASAGLSWDGARLAGHGASRSDDRRVSARLLSCARELHPTDGLRAAPTGDDAQTRTAGPGSEQVVLSDRELDVARLVLQGKTYSEIGETIFISPRTAEHHIAHIRRRLGASNRSDLIAKLRVLLEDPGRHGERAVADEGPVPEYP